MKALKIIAVWVAWLALFYFMFWFLQEVVVPSGEWWSYATSALLAFVTCITFFLFVIGSVAIVNDELW